MKKLFLTTVVALFSFAASAQFLVATELSKTDDGEGGESYSIEGLTNNMSFGYEVMDKITIGITMKDATTNTDAVSYAFAGDSVDDGSGNNIWDAGAGDTLTHAADEVEDGTVVADMQIFVRYAISDNMFLQLTTPMGAEEGFNGNDYMRVGAGYSFNVWGDVNAEFNYSMKVNGGEEGDRSGKMGIGVSMTF